MNQIEETVAGPLTRLQTLEFKQKRDDWENVRLEHAIRFLSNHFPQFGSKPYTGDTYTGDDKTTMMDSVPPALRKDFILAAQAAIGFIGSCFNGEGKYESADEE